MCVLQYVHIMKSHTHHRNNVVVTYLSVLLVKGKHGNGVAQRRRDEAEALCCAPDHKSHQTLCSSGNSFSKFVWPLYDTLKKVINIPFQFLSFLFLFLKL